MGCFLVLTWIVMLDATPASMRRVARSQDVQRPAILSLIVISTFASLLAIFFMLRNAKALSVYPFSLHLAVAGVTIVGGWLLIHTIFALHYAHTYYQRCESAHPAHAATDSDTSKEAGGLDFPNDWEPDYWDFMYYAFVIGMACQVSDVETTSPQMRRLTLLHSVLSFFFNNSILAMSINIIAGLI